MVRMGPLMAEDRQTSELLAVLAAARAHHTSGRRSQEEVRELRKRLTHLYRHYLEQEERLFFPTRVQYFSNGPLSPRRTGLYTGTGFPGSGPIRRATPSGRADAGAY